MRAAALRACVAASLCVQMLAIACTEQQHVYVGVPNGALTPVYLRDVRMQVQWAAPSLRGEEHALAAALVPDNYNLGRNLRVEKRTSLRVSATVYPGGAPAPPALLAHALARASGSQEAELEFWRPRGSAQGVDVTALLDSEALACHDMLRNLSAHNGWGAAVLVGDTSWRVHVDAAHKHACSSSINVTHAVLNCTDTPRAMHARLLRLGSQRVLTDVCSPMPPMLASTEAPASPASFSVACAPPPAPAGTHRCRQKSKFILRTNIAG
jgi:hypothetical protein